MSKGYLIFVLHAHLPFVRHPKHARFLQENWLFNAVSESFLPLLRMFNRLKCDNILISHSFMIYTPLCCCLQDLLMSADSWLLFSYNPAYPFRTQRRWKAFSHKERQVGKNTFFFYHSSLFSFAIFASLREGKFLIFFAGPVIPAYQQWQPTLSKICLYFRFIYVLA